MEQRSGKNQQITIPIASITERTRKVLPGADEARVTALTGLQGVRAAKSTGYQRELVRLRIKLGDKHPRVAALEQQIATNDLVAMHLAAEAQRAATPPVVAAQGTW